MYYYFIVLVLSYENELCEFVSNTFQLVTELKSQQGLQKILNNF